MWFWRKNIILDLVCFLFSPLEDLFGQVDYSISLVSSSHMSYSAASKPALLTTELW
jgi:hypothetical protein